MPNLFHYGRRALTLTGVLTLLGAAFSARGIAAESAPTAPELHTFTNESGASFKAQITGVTDDEVSLKREDGQTFQPKVSLFSKDDQAYIQQWVAKNAAAHGAGAFSFHPVPVKDVATTTSDAAAHRTLSAWKEYYKVAVKNLTMANWPTLHFRYIIFKQIAKPGELPPNDFTLQRFTGSFEAEKYAGAEERNFTLDKIDMQESSLAANTSYNNGAPKTAGDKFKGIWIRVYDEEDNLLQEWASDPDLIKNERWTAPLSGTARGPSASVPTPRTRAPRNPTPAP